MEIVYFVLGIVAVLLVLGVVIIVRVGTLVKELKEKVRESERYLDEVNKELRFVIKDTLDLVGDLKDVLHRRVDDVQNLLDRRVDTEMRDVYSQLDSRLDKLEIKIKKQIPPMNNELMKRIEKIEEESYRLRMNL